MKLLPYILSKIYLHFSTGNGPSTESALCQLYQHTSFPYVRSLKRELVLIIGRVGVYTD